VLAKVTDDSGAVLEAINTTAGPCHFVVVGYHR
jgi:hypothetical protein